VVLPLILPALLWRIFYEERFLTKNLPGYMDYCAKVRWRMIPKVF
jgi:protein-S-isoprenylcysteine O-methyltransferase Ste14